MQLSTRTKDYIIDTIALRSHLQILNKVFTDPKIIKILHGSKSDIVWLQKDLGLYIVNLFDTGEAARVLGMGASLANLLEQYCQVKTDKKFQLADWRMRPLPKEMYKYARMDTHYLHYIYDRMRKDLVNPQHKDDNPIAFLNSVWKVSKDICLQIYKKPKAKNNDYFTAIQKNVTLLGEGQLKVLEMLMIWRDYVARLEDESIKYIMPNDVLFDLARSTPKDISQLETILKRHPKHTKHVTILKYQENLLEKITTIISAFEAKLKKRFEEEKKQVYEHNPFTSSDEDEKPKKTKKIVPAKKVDPAKKVIEPKTAVPVKQETEQKKEERGIKRKADVPNEKPMRITFDSAFTTSRIFAQEDSPKNSENMAKIERFNKKVSLAMFLGIEEEEIPQTKKSKTLTEQIAECLPVDAKMEEEISKEDLGNAVMKVDEIKVQQVYIPQDEGDDKKQEEDPNDLPPSMREKYNIQKKGRTGNKRVKTGEDSELQNSEHKEGKMSVMDKIKNITKNTKKNMTNEVGEEEIKSQKK